MRLARIFSRTGAFAAIPVLNGVSTLLALPVVTAEFGASGWEAMAVGFSIGSAGSIIVELGWGVVGPLRVARSRPRSRSRALAYAWSLQARLVVLLPILVFAAGLPVLLLDEYEIEGAIMGAASALVGLSPTWYYTGTGEPFKILMSDSLPRLVSVLLSSAALGFGAPLVLYPLLLLVAGATSPLLGWQLGRFGPAKIPWLNFQRTRRLVALQSNVLGARIGLALYTSVPVIMVSILAPGILAVYTAADRLLRSGLQLLNSINLQLTGWVGRASSRSSREHRAWKALITTAFLSFASATTAALIVGPASEILFNGVATLAATDALVVAAVVAVTVLANGIARILLVRSRVNVVVRASWVRLIVSCIGVAAGAPFGVAGALAGLLLGECAALVYQVWIAYRSRPGRAA